MGLIYSKTEVGFIGSNIVLSSEKEQFLSSDRQVDKICYFKDPPFPLSIRHIRLSADCCPLFPKWSTKSLKIRLKHLFIGDTHGLFPSKDPRLPLRDRKFCTISSYTHWLKTPEFEPRLCRPIFLTFKKIIYYDSFLSNFINPLSP